MKPQRVWTESEPRLKRRTIAETTLKAISTGYTLNNVLYDLRDPCALSEKNTAYYAPNSLLSLWSECNSASRSSDGQRTKISILEVSALAGARLLESQLLARIGILNFASATKPGGGVLSGAQAQEESIARSSTLYPTLITATGQQFYDLHNNKDLRGGYYSHAMIYSPHVLLIRDDDGVWMEPLKVDVLTSAAVNAGVVKKQACGDDKVSIESTIAEVMKERMARVLYLFEKRGVKNLVLGSFGTGVFKNDVPAVAGNWAELLVAPGARFQSSFERVVFAILGRETFVEFKQTFESSQSAIS